MVINKIFRLIARKCSQKREKRIKKRKNRRVFLPAGRKGLLLFDLLPYFADMKNEFNAIVAVLSETDWNVSFTVTFADVCRSFDVDPVRMDRMFYDTFGMSGDEMLEQYRQGRMDMPGLKNIV